MKEKELNEVEKKIMKALENCDLNYLTDNEDDFFTQVVEPFREAFKEGNIPYANGATKGVLIFNKYNFVIKIPFKYEDDEVYSGADSYINTWDYCEAEVEKYADAKAENVEDCFAKTEFLGYVHGYPIYEQEMACVWDNYSSSSHTQEDEEFVNNYCENTGYDCFNVNWLSDVFLYYGEEHFCHLMNFIENYNVADLHGGNLGYIDMRPVLVDYAGFNH